MVKSVWLLAKTEYACNKRGIILVILSLFAFAFLVFGIFCEIVSDHFYMDATLNNTPELIKKLFEEATRFVLFTFVCGFFLAASIAFQKYWVNGAFAMMLPAPQWSKFIYVVVRNFILLPLILFAIYCINHTIWNLILGTDFQLIRGQSDTILELYAYGAIAFACSVMFRKGYVYALALFAFITTIFLKILSYFPPIGDVLLMILLSVFILASIAFTWYKFKNLALNHNEK